MTTPAPPRQQRQQPPPKAAPPPAAIPPQALAAMALPLAVMLVTATSAAAVVAALKAASEIAEALFWLALLWVLSRIVMAHPPPVTGVVGAASEQVSRLNAARRAQYALAAAQRVTRAMVQARARGKGVTAAGQQALERERRFYQQHLAAMWQRATAAGKTDMAALEYGPLLGWNSVKDARTSPECRAADGRNYYAGDPPLIGYPGAVHPSCRCWPSAPHPGGKLLPSARARARRAA